MNFAGVMACKELCGRKLKFLKSSQKFLAESRWRFKFISGKRKTDAENGSVFDFRFDRHLQVDPLNDKSRRWSLHNYAMNNPIRFISLVWLFRKAKTC
ncbi:MAG: hypothetical protein C5B59_00270 [Bacteroidetes bacterium]|nr:MAG: hypothetical protein C5B59_00270 [Bacteroidota bacterium]